MSSVCEQIVARAKTALNVAPPTGTPLAERATTFDVEEGERPKVLVYWTEDTEERIGGPSGPLKRHDLVLVVEIHVAATATIGADEAADPHRVHAVKVLSDRAVYGDDADGYALVTEVEVLTSQASYGQGRRALCTVAVLFGIDYQSSAADPSKVV